MVNNIFDYFSLMVMVYALQWLLTVFSVVW